jgi:hypothetical protein
MNPDQFVVADAVYGASGSSETEGHVVKYTASLCQTEQGSVPSPPDCDSFLAGL